MAKTEVGIKLSVDGAQKAESDLRGVSGGIEKIGVSAASVRNLIGGLTGAFAGFVSVRAVMQASDAVTTLNNQLRLATGSASSAATAYQSLFEIAQRSRVNFTELGGTFATITRATQELGLSQKQVLEVTESIANAITVSGTSAQASQAALMQLGQGLASGVLRGEELNSVMEQTPRLARALADGLGVPIGKLREMGKAGELTAESIIGALRSQNAILARELSQSTATVGQAFTQLQNAAVKATGKLDETTGASQSLAKAIQGTAVAVQTLGEAVAKHGDVIKSTFGAMAGAAAAAGLAAVAANIGKIRIAFLALTATMAANPVTLALLGIGAVAGAIIANPKDKYASLREQLEATNRVLAQTNLEEDRRNRLLQRRADLQKQLDKEFLTSNAGGGRGSVNPDVVVPRVSDVANGSGSGKPKNVRPPKPPRDTFETETLRAYEKAMDDFGRTTSEATAKAEGLSSTQARLRDIMADPTWARLSPQLQEQVKAAAQAAEASINHAASVEAARKAMADAAQELQEYNNAQRSVVQDAIAEATAAEDSLRNYGLLRSEVEKLKLAKLGEARESAALAGEDVSNIEERIAAQRRLVDAVKGMEVREASTESAKHAADEWRKASDQINQSLTDALMRGFESGKGFARSLRDAVTSMFKTMVLRPIVQAIVQPIAGPIAQGISGIVGGGMGGLGGMLSMFGSAGSSFGMGLGAGFSALTGEAGLMGALSAGATSIGAGSFAAGLGTIAGALGPIALGVAAVHSMLSRDRGGPKVDGRFGFAASGTGLASDQSLSPTVMATVQQLQAQYAQAARLLGGDPGAIRFGMGVSTDPRGTSPSFLDITGVDRAGGVAFNLFSRNIGRSSEELQKAIAEYVATATIEGLKRSNLGPQYQQLLDTVAAGASTEVKQAAVQTLVEVKRFTDTIRSMGAQFAYVADMSVEARKRIVDLAGGIDSLANGQATYAQNFMSAEEQRRMLASSLAEAMRAGFVNITDSQLLSYNRETIRQWVNSIDLNTAHGQQAYAALMANMGPLSQLIDANEMAAQAMQGAADSMEDAARAMKERQIATFRSAFLPMDEQRRLLAQDLSRALAASFINAPTDYLMGYRQHDIRNWVEGLDQTTEVGRRVFDGIMANIDALAQMVDMNQAAADEAAAAFQEMQDSAQRFRDAVKAVGETIQDEILRLRGGTKSGGENLAALWARFGTTTGQARAGDTEAAGKLAGLSQSIEEAVKGTARERSEVDTVREQLARSLAATMDALNRAAGNGAAPIVGVLKPLPLQPGTSTPTQTGGSQGADLLKAIKVMGEQNAQQQEESALQQRQMTALINRLTATINRWDTDGLPEERVLG